jgi:hypothetical protein
MSRCGGAVVVQSLYPQETEATVLVESCRQKQNKNKKQNKERTKERKRRRREREDRDTNKEET